MVTIKISITELNRCIFVTLPHNLMKDRVYINPISMGTLTCIHNNTIVMNGRRSLRDTFDNFTLKEPTDSKLNGFIASLPTGNHEQPSDHIFFLPRLSMNELFSGASVLYNERFVSLVGSLLLLSVSMLCA